MKKLSRSFFIVLIAIAATFQAKGQLVQATNGSLQLTVLRSALIPARLSGPELRLSPEQQQKRWMVEFRVFVKNVGKREVTIPTYFGFESAQVRSSSKDEVVVVYRGDLESAGEATFVKSPIFYRFVTLRPGEAAFLPQYMNMFEEPAMAPPHTFVFQMSEEFGNRYKCWSGNITVSFPRTKETGPPRK